ncbi:cation:proton antiporter [Candidatus Woesearchaeota archaeon]|nr:cation:proton antiporter [Candidatus Woesearchaeota archaeon]
MEPLLILTHLTILLMLGVLSCILSRWLKIPNILFLLLVGLIIGNLNYNNSPLIDFPQIFIISLGILSLVMLIFDSSAKFKWREFDTLTIDASKLSIMTILLYFIIISGITYALFGMRNIFFAIIFSAIISGTSADTVLTFFKEKQNRITGLLEVESIINTPLTVLLPFIVISFMENLSKGQGVLPEYMSQFIGLLQQFITGIGAGVVIGIITIKLMKKFFSQAISPIIVITSCILAYILAENLSGSGVLGVTVLGLMYGNYYVKKKKVLTDFSGMFSSSLVIIVFILIGLKITPSLSWSFFWLSMIIFIATVAIRFLSVFISFYNSDYRLKEKVFIALNAPKGIAAAIVAFSLLNYNIGGVTFSTIPEGNLVLNLVLAMIFYSMILSTIIMRFSKYFIRVEVAAK